MELNKLEPEYYRNLLKYPLIGVTNDLRFDFNFEAENFGSFKLSDLKSDKIYNGTFKLRFFDNKCNLMIRAVDFEFQFTTGYMHLLDEDFEKQIHFLTKELEGFPKGFK